MAAKKGFVPNSEGFCAHSSVLGHNRGASAGAEKAGSVAQVEHDLSNPADPIYTVDEAGRVCGASAATIRRRLDDGMKGAYREGHGTRAPWRIPRQALVNAGLLAGPVTEEAGLDPYDYERIIAAKDEVIETLNRLVASQEARLTLQADLIGRMEALLNPKPTPAATGTLKEMKRHA